jgi:hypothetical protein
MQKITGINRIYMPKRGVKTIWLSAAVAILVLVGGCRTQEVKSKWRNQEIIVDGQNTEWRDALNYHDEKSHVVIGVMNDRDNLYLCLSTQDMKTSAMMLHSGITVWIDSEGGEKKIFGIRFPVETPADTSAMPTTPRQKPKPIDIEKLLEISQQEVEIFSSNKSEGVIMMADEAKGMGIAVRLSMNKGVLVYELQIPLTHNDMLPLHVAADLSKPIGVGFEAGKMDIDKMHDAKRGMGGEGRGGPRGGMGSGPMGGMPGGKAGGMPPGMPRGGQRLEPLELWTKVDLASGN